MTSAESCPWQGTTTGSGDCWGPPSWKREDWQGSAGHQDAHGAAMCSCSNAEQRPGLHWELCHSWQREGILSLCSTAVRQPWSAGPRAGLPRTGHRDRLDRVQHGAMKLMEGLQRLCHEERLRELALPSLEQSRLRASHPWA